MALIGARPRFDSYGRLAGAELIPLAELGRPRIDVIVTLSGIFRDLLPLQTRMIAEAAWLAASADEPLDRNFVRKHSLAHQPPSMAATSRPPPCASSPMPRAAYGANVNLMIDDGAWTDPDELADSLRAAKGLCLWRQRRAGAPGRAACKTALAEVDLRLSEPRLVELGVTDIDQYVDALGGISRAVTRAKGSSAPVYIGDQTQGAAKVRTLAEQVALETPHARCSTRSGTRACSRHGYEGVRQIEGHVTNTMGWSATTGEGRSLGLSADQRDLCARRRDARPARQRSIPRAAARVANRLIEASDRKFWAPDAATLAALHAASDELEDRARRRHRGGGIRNT